MSAAGKFLVALVGPTAVGKTAMAVRLAEHFQTVVVSADSRQCYREMSIGTAKPSLDERQGVPHYFIDSHHLENNLSAGDFERQGLHVLDTLFHEQGLDLVVLAGGSGLFVNALCKGLDELPTALPGIRDKWNSFFAENGINALASKVAEVDPKYFQSVDRSNPQRLIRALEVWESTGQPFSSFRQGQQTPRPFETLYIGLDLPREVLYQRINARVDLMMERGLLQEVEGLLPYRELPVLKTVGYAELFQYLDGDFPLDVAVDKIKQHTRHYAKRQLTWFRRSQDTSWFHPQAFEQIVAHLQSQLQNLKK